MKHEAPQFITQLVTSNGVKGVSPATIRDQKTALEVKAGDTVTDMLLSWYEGDGPQTDITGWQATWDAYWTPFDKDAAEPRIVADPSDVLVYEGAACTPDNLLASTADKPTPLNNSGVLVSPGSRCRTSPACFVVETVTDTKDDVIRRGTCGVVSETAMIPMPPPDKPKPTITTNAPKDSNVGDKVKDEAILTGPFPKYTQVEFWYQHTDYINPGAARDQLKCAVPDPNNMDDAVKIGVVTLDHDITEGVTEKLYSPGFTSDKEGCTWIKEIAWAPGEGPNRTVIAEGYFGAVNERTMWHQPLAVPKINTGGSLPMAGAGAAPWIAIVGGSLLLLGVG